jgi:hypothetical protein
MMEIENKQSEVNEMKCFYSDCGNKAIVEILEDNFEIDEHGPRITGNWWKPWCWSCMVKFVINPGAIKENGIRTARR